MEDENIKKQQELDSSTKAVRTAGRIAANYYTGGTYEKLRNAPGIGKTVRKLEDKTANAVTNGAMKGNINAKDVEAIKNRKGINEAIPFKNRGDDTEDVGSSLDKKDSLDSDSGLDDKKGLNGKEGLSKKEKNSKGDNSSIDISEEKGKAEGKGDSLFDSINPFAKFKRLKRKVKIYIILAGIVLAFGLFFLIILSAMMAVDTFVSSITNFFGVSEQDVDDGNSTIEGLYTDDQYLFDENGNPLTGEELVNNLKSNETCKITFWNSIGDFFRGNNINDYCYLMRTIQRETKDNNMDKALVIATLVYGFDSQPKDTQYFDNEDIPSDNVSASEHYESLIKALQGNDKINKDTIKKIVDNSVVHKPVYYYTWTIDYNENSNSVAKVGKCVRGTYSDGQYDINKWKVFMRFGEEVADKYDQYVNASKVYEMSSEECRGEVSTSELLQRVNESNDGNGVGRLDSSVSEAINYLREFTTSSLEPFNQHADVDSKTKDQFTSYNGIIFDYRNGFAFNYYPGFKDAMSDNVTNIEYDDIFTPKEIETILDEIQDRKIEMNEILMFPDQDSDDYYYGADRSS